MALEQAYVFEDKNVRQAFIRKVYLILMVQLLLTFLISAYFVYSEEAKEYLKQHLGPIFIICLITSVFTLFTILCCENTRHTFPVNYTLLIIFTLALAFLVAVTVVYSAAENVVIAVGITSIVFLSLTLFAFQTVVDFTGVGPYLFSGLLIMVLFSLIFFFLPPSNLFLMIYCSVGVLIFSFYIIYDTQLMIGGNYKYSFSSQEYIFAALCLYLDIINLFLFILRLLNACSNE